MSDKISCSQSEPPCFNGTLILMKQNAHMQNPMTQKTHRKTDSKKTKNMNKIQRIEIGPHEKIEELNKTGT